MTQATQPPANRSQTVQRLLFIGKICFMGFMIILLNIPMFMVESLIFERNQRRDSADWEVVQTWGRDQIVQGPILSVPYQVHVEIVGYNERGKAEKRIKTHVEVAHFLPENLQITGSVTMEARQRGIFKVPLYKSDLQVKGSFLKPDLSQFKISDKDILWDEASLSVGIPDMRAIQESSRLNWENAVLSFEPGSQVGKVFPSGIQSTAPGLKAGVAGQETPFSFDLKLAGSKTLQFLPLGKQSQIALNSSWPHPSFMGNYLPTQREVTDKGFSANWKILHLGRNYPQAWLHGEITAEKIQESAFGVSLLFPVDTYQMTTRSAKYAILFILLTFVTFFFFEIFTKQRIHPIQYLLVGFSLCLFYLLLLSLSEHLKFGHSYLIAGVATIASITAYSAAVLKTGGRALAMGAVLSALYAYLYILLQLQDFALLLGSAGLFVILGLIMIITRKIDWYSLQSGQTGRTPEALPAT